MRSVKNIPIGAMYIQKIYRYEVLCSQIDIFSVKYI